MTAASLFEAEALARKAARGAGYSWGLAEEAGKAVRWLCAAGLPGAEALAALLARTDGTDYAALCPTDCTNETWQAPGGLLCPLIAGAALSDRATSLANGAPVTLGDTAQPLLLLPFVAFAADMAGAGLTLTWPGLGFTRAGHQTRMNATDAALRVARQGGITVQRATDAPGPRLRRAWRAEIPAAAMDALQRFAQRTYAPETPQSRIAGAGAGLSDND